MNAVPGPPQPMPVPDLASGAPPIVRARAWAELAERQHRHGAWSVGASATRLARVWADIAIAENALPPLDLFPLTSPACPDTCPLPGRPTP